MRLSRQLFQDKFNVPDNWNALESYKIFEAMGFVEFPSSGFPLFLPVGKKVMGNISDIIRQEAAALGYEEISAPLVQQRSNLERTGRDKEFGDEFMELKGGLEGLILTPTNEEVFLDLARRGLSSYRQLPVRMYQIAEKFRNIKKAKGILRSRQFLMCDMVSMDASEQSLRESASLFEDLVKSVFSRMELPALRVEKNDGKYVDFLIPCKEGETSVIIERAGAARYAGQGEQGASKASSVAMYFIFERVGSENPSYQSADGLKKEILLGTYGFGIQRCFHAAVEVFKDGLGINFPKALRPFEASVIVMSPEDEQQLQRGISCYQWLSQSGIHSLLDDRMGKTLKQKAELSDAYGIPSKIVIGNKEMLSSTLLGKRRGGHAGESIPFGREPLMRYVNG